jgi:hypothetical protein
LRYPKCGERGNLALAWNALVVSLNRKGDRFARNSSCRR